MSRVRRSMTPCERGAWIDTEGHIFSGIRKGGRRITAAIRITQAEREPLEDYCEGARQDGIACNVYKEGHVYRAAITSIKGIDKEIRLTYPYIRTERKEQQIQKFRRLVREKPIATKRLRYARFSE